MKRLLLLLVTLALHRSATADDLPWERGVSNEDRVTASALFEEANQLFGEESHAAALEKYKQAITLWQHPLIQLNMAVTLVRLDRILEAADLLDAALRFGQSPYPTTEEYRLAVDYQKLVGASVGTVEATCSKADTHVLLDGKPWFSCPATKQRRVLAGEHVVHAQSKGFVPSARRVVVAGGATVREQIELVPVDAAVTLVYPTPRWIPWTVLGAGLAIAASGVALYFDGKSGIDQYEQDLTNRCPNGCVSSMVSDLERDRDRAVLEGRISIGVMITGGAAAVAGVVWASLNRPRRVLPTFDLAPTTGGATASLGWRF